MTTLPRHSACRPRYRPMDRAYVAICTCGARLEGLTRAEAEARIVQHDTGERDATGGRAP